MPFANIRGWVPGVAVWQGLWRRRYRLAASRDEAVT